VQVAVRDDFSSSFHSAGEPTPGRGGRPPGRLAPARPKRAGRHYRHRGGRTSTCAASHFSQQELLRELLADELAELAEAAEAKASGRAVSAVSGVAVVPCALGPRLAAFCDHFMCGDTLCDARCMLTSCITCSPPRLPAPPARPSPPRRPAKARLPRPLRLWYVHNCAVIFSHLCAMPVVCPSLGVIIIASSLILCLVTHAAGRRLL
jgi:hypothetical protein